MLCRQPFALPARDTTSRRLPIFYTSTGFFKEPYIFTLRNKYSYVSKLSVFFESLFILYIWNENNHNFIMLVNYSEQQLR